MGLLFKYYEEFQNGDSRALNQAECLLSLGLCEFTGRVPVKQPCLQPSHWLFQMASSRCPGPLVSSRVQSINGRLEGGRENRWGVSLLPLTVPWSQHSLAWWCCFLSVPLQVWDGNSFQLLAIPRYLLGTSRGLVVFLSPIYALSMAPLFTFSKSYLSVPFAFVKPWPAHAPMKSVERTPLYTGAVQRSFICLFPFFWVRLFFYGEDHYFITNLWKVAW